MHYAAKIPELLLYRSLCFVYPIFQTMLARYLCCSLPFIFFNISSFPLLLFVLVAVQKAATVFDLDMHPRYCFQNVKN